MAELPTVTLRDPSSPLTSTFVPTAGMICTSLSDDGIELLGQRRGLQAYLTAGKTMGIPILYPWANRLSADNYGIDGAVVTLIAGTGGVRTDAYGAPMHGVLAAYPGWLVIEQTDNALSAVVDYGGKPRLLASFPFPHLLRLDVTLADRALTIRTTVIATTAASVPMCFGFHPYLTSRMCPGRNGSCRHRPCVTCRWTIGEFRPARPRSGPAAPRPLAAEHSTTVSTRCPPVPCSRSRAVIGPSR